jgi:hypothetical protein
VDDLEGPQVRGIPLRGFEPVDDDSNSARHLRARPLGDRPAGLTLPRSNSDDGTLHHVGGWPLDVFASLASNLVPDDGNGLEDIFIAYGPATTFADGFEAGSTSRWSETVP